MLCPSINKQLTIVWLEIENLYCFLCYSFFVLKPSAACVFAIRICVDYFVVTFPLKYCRMMIDENVLNKQVNMSMNNV